VLACLLLCVWESVQATKLGYQVEDAKRQIKSLRTSNDYLRQRISEAVSPSELVATAEKKLGMIYPEPEHIILLEQYTSADNGTFLLTAAFGKTEKTGSN